MKKIMLLVLILVFIFSVTGIALAAGQGKALGNVDKAEKAAGDQIKQKDQLKTQDQDRKDQVQLEIEEKAAVKTANKAEAKQLKLEEKIRVRGDQIKFDVPPVVKDGRTLIPVRAISEGMNAEVSWDEENKTITIVKEDTTIELTLGSQEMLVNGETVLLDVPAESISSRTLVPMRFIAEALGLKVNYDEETGEIDLDDENDEEVAEEEAAGEENSDDEEESLDDETSTDETENTDTEDDEADETGDETVQ